MLFQIGPYYVMVLAATILFPGISDIWYFRGPIYFIVSKQPGMTLPVKPGMTLCHIVQAKDLDSEYGNEPVHAFTWRNCSELFFPSFVVEINSEKKTTRIKLFLC